MASNYTDILQANIVQFKGAIYRRKPRIYSCVIVRDATAGKSFQGTINLDPGLPFMLSCMKADDTADPDGAGATTGLENWSVQIQDSESQYLWSSTAVGRIQQFGGREFGYQLPFEVLLRAQTYMNFTITNRTTSVVAGTSTIALIGFSLLPMAQQGAM